MRLLIAASNDSNIRYATQLSLPDPFIWVKLEKHEYVIVSKLEYSRAKKEVKRGTKVILMDDVDMKAIRKPAQRQRNLADIAAAFLLSYNATTVEVPENFWALHLETLREHNIRPKVVGPFFPSRLRKTEYEIKCIKEVGVVAKKAFQHALTLLKESTIEWDDALIYKGKKLTSERLRLEIEQIFLAHDCASSETIVACAEQSAEPHNRGTGVLRAGQPIIIDIFPRSTKTGYYFDMTRTLIKGTPSKELKKQYQTVRKAQQAALDIIAPGKGKHVHTVVEEVFAKAGYETSNEEGFIHSTGHGLGLDIHERPRISATSDEQLEEGMVVTVEPGLYYLDTGGVRIEDTVLITANGHQNLTNLPKLLIIP